MGSVLTARANGVSKVQLDIKGTLTLELVYDIALMSLKMS